MIKYKHKEITSRKSSLSVVNYKKTTVYKTVVFCFAYWREIDLIKIKNQIQG
jgi:hypothetical protein